MKLHVTVHAFIFFLLVFWGAGASAQKATSKSAKKVETRRTAPKKTTPKKAVPKKRAIKKKNPGKLLKRPVPARRKVLNPSTCQKALCAESTTVAVAKAAWACAFKWKRNCTCVGGQKACGRNMRSVKMYHYNCTCPEPKKYASNPTIPTLCLSRVCAYKEKTAVQLAGKKCGTVYRKNCDCRRSAVKCGKGWFGRIKYYYGCTCRAVCKQTFCAALLFSKDSDAAVRCGLQKGYTKERCKCKSGRPCGVGASKQIQCVCQ